MSISENILAQASFVSGYPWEPRNTSKGQVYVSANIFNKARQAHVIADKINIHIRAKIAHVSSSKQGGFRIVIPRAKIQASLQDSTAKNPFTDEMLRDIVEYRVYSEERVPPGRYACDLKPKEGQPGQYELLTDKATGIFANIESMTVPESEVRSWLQNVSCEKALEIYCKKQPDKENCLTNPGFFVRESSASHPEGRIYVLENLQDPQKKSYLVPTEQGIEVWDYANYNAHLRCPINLLVKPQMIELMSELYHINMC